MLVADFSPEQIVRRAKEDGILCVSHQTIYSFINKDRKTGGLLYQHLQRKGKSYRKRGESKDKQGKNKRPSYYFPRTKRSRRKSVFW